MKPLFIPLYKRFFEQFERGQKQIEYRKYGPRWNEKTCIVGRAVTLSCGYGKKRRLKGVITFFKREGDTAKIGIKITVPC